MKFKNEKTSLLFIVPSDLFCYLRGLLWKQDGIRGRTLIFSDHELSVFSSSSDTWTYVISIYDTEGQCVAFSCALPAVSRMFLLDSVLMILTQDGTLSALTEKNISAKLDILFKKNLYDLAVG